MECGVHVSVHLWIRERDDGQARLVNLKKRIARVTSESTILLKLSKEGKEDLGMVLINCRKTGRK